MAKRAIAILLTAAILSLSGCASIIEGEYSSSSPHEAGTISSSQTAERTIEVANRTELEAALNSFVESAVEYAKIKFTAYDGEIETDLAASCMKVTNNTPLGSFAVYYINYDLNKIVSYYEADISITYKRSKNDISGIIEISDSSQFEESLLSALEGHSMGISLYISNGDIDPTSTQDTLDTLYYSHPASIPYMPHTMITVYPESGYPCIVDISFTYPYSSDSTKNRSEMTAAKAQEMIDALGDRSGDDIIRYFAEMLSENITFDSYRESLDDYSKWYSIYTAYGALVMQKAAGEGFAMAMKILCDEVGIDCTVVRGRLNNVSHSWNIVRLENGSCYHLDCSVLSEEDGEIFYTDNEMVEKYWWDTSMYDKCDGPSLQPEQPEEDAGSVPASVQDGEAGSSEGSTHDGESATDLETGGEPSAGEAAPPESGNEGETSGGDGEAAGSLETGIR